MVFILLDPLLMSAIVTHRITEAIDNKIILRLIPLNILKASDKVRYYTNCPVVESLGES